MELEDHMQISKGADPRIPSRNRLRVRLGLLHELHRRATLQKNWSLWSAPLIALETPPFSQTQ